MHVIFDISLQIRQCRHDNFSLDWNPLRYDYCCFILKINLNNNCAVVQCLFMCWHSLCAVRCMDFYVVRLFKLCSEITCI